MYSLYLTKDFVEGEDFLLSNGDVVFDARIAHEVMSDERPDLIVSDKGRYSDESMKITLSESGDINDISKKTLPNKAYGNSIDLYKFSAKSSKELFSHISNIIENDNNVKDWTEVAIQELLQSGRLTMQPFDISKKRWVEIDNYEDLARGDKLFSGFDLSLKNKKLFFLDLDGTIYLGNKIIPGSKNFLDKLKELNISYYFLSNNSSRSKGDYVNKLQEIGIKTTKNKIINQND